MSLNLDETWFKNLALYRLNKSVFWDGVEFKLTITSGKDINISERVFNYYKKQLQASNQMIKKGILVYNDGSLMINRLKSNGSIQTTSTNPEDDDDDPNRDGCGRAISDADWSLFEGMEITLSNTDVSALTSYGSLGEAGAIFTEFGGPIGATAAGILAVGTANINYVNSAANNGNGVTIHISNTTLLGAAAGGIGVGMANPGLGAITAGGIIVGFMSVKANEKSLGSAGC